MKSSNASKLTIAREARGLTLRECAEYSGIDVGLLSKVERGLGGLSMQAAVRLARTLGLKDAAKALSIFLPPTQSEEPSDEVETPAA